jgi:hypothetical protein
VADRAPDVCTSLRHHSRPTENLLPADHAGNSRRHSPPRKYRPKQRERVTPKPKRPHRKRSTGLAEVSPTDHTPQKFYPNPLIFLLRDFLIRTVTSDRSGWFSDWRRADSLTFCRPMV